MNLNNSDHFNGSDCRRYLRKRWNFNTDTLIHNHATFATGTGTANGALTVNGNMTMGAGAECIHAGNNPTQNVKGNMIVKGAGTGLSFFKRNATSATDGGNHMQVTGVFDPVTIPFI